MTTATDVETTSSGNPPPRSTLGTRLIRILGWLLVGAGALVMLYVVYLLWFTGLETERAQTSLLEAWEEEVGELDGLAGQPSLSNVPAVDLPDITDGGDRDRGAPPDVAGAVAVMAFERPGSDVRPVTDDYLVVVDGVGVRDLQRGPGQYPSAAAPGAAGNFAVAGHRVTYSAPFHRLDDLREGDEIHVWDRNGDHHVYRFARQEIVLPSAAWVLDSNPIGSDRPIITLTTCHPRFSNRQRLIVFGELVS